MINGFVIFGGLFFAFSTAFLPAGVGAFVDLASMQIVFGIVAAVSFFFYLRHSMAVFEVWLPLGIPVGLLRVISAFREWLYLLPMRMRSALPLQ